MLKTMWKELKTILKSSFYHSIYLLLVVDKQ